MKTILFVVGDALGHVGRSLVIARAIVAANPACHIVFAHLQPGFSDSLVRDEFDCLALDSTDRGERFANELELAMIEIDPDLICIDINPVPWLYLVRFPEVPTAYITNFFITSLSPAETFQDRALSKDSAAWNRRRQERGMPLLSDAKKLYSADAVLLCDPPALIPQAGASREPYHVVGPCVWQPDGEVPASLQRNDRLLVASFGSTGLQRPPDEVVKRLSKVLECDETVWLTAPGNDLGHTGGGLNSTGVPLRGVLKKCPLAITQAGAGSTYAALMEGVPVAVCPSHRNHEILAEYLVAAGVGILLNELADLEPAQIRQTVADMKSRVETLASSSGWEQGPDSAAAILCSLIDTKGPVHER